MNSTSRKDVLILGGGLAGSTLAIALARAGREPLLVERYSTASHKVCGEFLSPEALPILRKAGINPEVLGAHVIHSVRLAARDLLAEVPLPSSALSLTRKRLDAALLECAQQSGAALLCGHSVERLAYCTRAENSGYWQAQVKNSAQQSINIEANHAFIATGKNDLRGWQRAAGGSQSNLVAMKMYFRLAPKQQAELSGHVELILFPGGYAGLQMVEGDAANLCVLITREKFRTLASRWQGMLEHMQNSSTHLARRLGGASELLERPLALSAIPYGYCLNVPLLATSPWRLGDQAAVIPSFCGDGMAIALYTASRAAEMFLAGANQADYHAEMRQRFKRRLHLSTLLSRLLIKLPTLAQAVRIWPDALTQIFSATRLPGTWVQNSSQ
jgi:flavin-dependent dehydrogenase